MSYGIVRSVGGRLTTVLLLAVLLLGGAAAIGAGHAVAAGGGSGGGGCNIFTQTCGVGVGDPGSPGGPGSGDPGGGGSGSSGGPSTPGCHNTDPMGTGCDPCNTLTTGIPSDPAACAVFEQNLFCSELNPTGIDYATWENFLKLMNCAGNPYTEGSPAVAAHDALAAISFPKPSGDRSPSQNQLYGGYAFTYTGLWTYYWTSADTWVDKSATASDGAQTATVTATPTALDFDPGDGSGAMVCDGPGRPWANSDGNAAPDLGACGYQYRRVTSSPLSSTQTLVWTLTWKVSGDAGPLPSAFSTSTTGQLNVMQIQTVVTR
jgi:hypothetical protein